MTTRAGCSGDPENVSNSEQNPGQPEEDTKAK
jgi:hypothetical protein